MIETGSYTEFSKIVHEGVGRKLVPITGTIELTNRCPLTCAHCYNNLPMGDAHARNLELTTEQHFRIVDEIAEMGCLWLLYSGGEIFARRDFLDIYKHAKKAGLLVTLFTNGILINESIADTLADWRPFVVEITLYGRTRETYERLTGIPGSYDKCLRGIELLRERGIPLKLKTVAVSINKHEVYAMQQFAEDLGLEFKFDPMINPRIDCSSSPLAVRLNPQDIVNLDLQDPKRVAEWRRLAIDFAPPPLAEGAWPQVYDCGAGINSWAIDPYGQLTMCVLSHKDNYDLKQGTFREGWEHFLRNVRTRPATRITKCTSCALRSLCGMCAANGELENEDPEKPIDYLCRVAHLRARAFDVDVRPHGDCEYCIGAEKSYEIDAMLQDVGGTIEPMMLPETTTIASGCGGGCTSCSIPH
jgi:radical SAM protein with 4Fe4S-binding SPASM domain